MLELQIPEVEYYDEEKEEFFSIDVGTLKLEHSLVSLAEWEGKWHEPFIQYKEDEERSLDKVQDYVRCMTLNEGVDSRIYQLLSPVALKKINDYINEPMTATWFREDGKSKSRQIITAEIIYYWMIALEIPFECQYWHLNRLLTLIRVCNEKNQPKKKMSKRDRAQQQHALNAKRKAAHHTRG